MKVRRGCYKCEKCGLRIEKWFIEQVKKEYGDYGKNLCAMCALIETWKK